MTRKEVNRNKIQEYACYLATKFKHILLSWATGCGKSLAAIMIIDNDIKKSTEDRGSWDRWYIIVAERQHITNWQKEFASHGYKYLLELGYVDIFCYNSLHKYKDRSANIVLDEAHSVTDLRLDCLSTIKANKIISLSATVERDREKQLASLSPLYKYEVSTDKAIKAGILPSPIVVKVPIKLSPKLQESYDSLTNNINIRDNEVQQKQYEIEELIRLVPTASKIGLLKKEVTKLDSEILALRMSRKNLLANSKSTSVEKLIDNMKSWNKRHIVFTGSLAQTKRLAKEQYIDISSVNTSKENDERIENFNRGLIGSLICYKMLRQGTNLNNIQMGIVIQLDSKQLSFVQMMGRIFRSVRPVLFVFVAEGTVDELYWNNCSQGLDSSYIMSYQEYINNHHEKET